MSNKKDITLMLNAIKDHYSFKTNTEFANFLGIKPQTLSSWYSRNMLDYELVYSKCVGLDANWLLSGQGKMLKSKKNGEVNGEVLVKNDKKTPTVLPLNEAEPVNIFGSINNTIEIPIIDISAAAGSGAINPDYAEHLGVIRLPDSMVKSGTHYCVRIKGDSMSPTLQDSDYLIIRKLDASECLYATDEHVFVVVERSGIAYVKRVKNRLDKGFIVLMSDNLDKSQYPNFNLQTDEIFNMFHAEWHFSAKMQNINDTYYKRLKSLEDIVTEQGNMINNVLKRIEEK